jgi:hypothetical protein
MNEVLFYFINIYGVEFSNLYVAVKKLLMINILLVNNEYFCYFTHKINNIMKNLKTDKFFSDINFESIVDTIKGVYMSDGAMSTLLDFERVLDEADLYAFRNWILGELVDGPVIGRYSCKCTFMWPYKLMPDPRAITRLTTIGCKIAISTGEIKIPVEVKSYDDFIPGTRYPKLVSRKVWFVEIEIPFELMDDIKEGSIELADQTIDLSEIQDAYDEDLDSALNDKTGVKTMADQINNGPEEGII